MCRPTSWNWRRCTQTEPEDATFVLQGEEPNLKEWRRREQRRSRCLPLRWSWGRGRRERGGAASHASRRREEWPPSPPLPVQQRLRSSTSVLLDELHDGAAADDPGAREVAELPGEDVRDGAEVRVPHAVWGQPRRRHRL